MVEPAPEQRVARNTEAEIYEAAVRLIAERGYHGTSLRALAGEVGLQMSSAYHYFPSKQLLLLRIMDRTMRDLIATVQEAVAGVDDPAEQLRAAIRGHVGFHAHRRREAFITDSELRALEPANRDRIVALRDEYERLFLRILEQGVRRQVFRPHDTKLAVYALMAVCTDVAVWYRPEGRLTLEEIADSYFSMFLRGIAAARRGGEGKRRQ